MTTPTREWAKIARVRTHGLSWRIGLPILLLVLTVTLTLALLMRSQIVAQKTERLEQLAEANATFISQASLPATDRLARELTHVTGFDVFFLAGGNLTPRPDDEQLQRTLLELETDGSARTFGRFEVVAVQLDERTVIALVGQRGQELFHPRIVQVVLAIWVLSLLFAWLVSRGLVKPLRNLADQVRHIERPESLALPEVARQDEIGDVARAITQTQDALHSEREQRARIEKLAVLGRMTASLAHEIRNPIAAIKMHAQLLRGDAASGTRDVIEGEAERIENLLNQWMYLTRPEPPVLCPTDLGDLIDQTIAKHRPQYEHAGVTVDTKKHGQLIVDCDPRRLEHVVRNVLTNAIQAMPEGGRLDVTAHGDGNRLELVFTDSGPGFSPDAQARFAEYFFSEKEGGMGIGLSVANEILSSHGGELHIDNAAAGGGRVRMVLPQDGAGR